MSASDHLNRLQFIKAAGDKPEAYSFYHQIKDTANPHENLLAWHKDSGEIRTVMVHASQERQGIATAMWDKAHQISRDNPDVIAPKHSAIRSIEGSNWAKKVGGNLPPARTYEDGDE